MMNTCDGVGVGEGSGLAAWGGVWTAATGVGLGWTTLPVAGPQAPIDRATTIAAPMRLRSKRWDLAVRPERGGRSTSLRLEGEDLLEQGSGGDQPTAKGLVEAEEW